MPYLTSERKEYIDGRVGPMKNAGDLNYAIHNLIEEYVAHNKVSYGTYNEIVGALECVKQEVYRRAVAPYEDEKAALNGDIRFYSIEPAPKAHAVYRGTAYSKDLY